MTRHPATSESSGAHVPAGRRDSVPAYVVAAIGNPPAFGDERAEYERVARALCDYRDRHSVVGREPLGPVPTDALQRAHYEEVRRELRLYERRLGRARELPGPDLGIGGR